MLAYVQKPINDSLMIYELSDTKTSQVPGELELSKIISSRLSICLNMFDMTNFNCVTMNSKSKRVESREK